MEDFFNQTRNQLRWLCSRHFAVPEQHSESLLRAAYKDFAREPWNNSRLPKALQQMGERFSTQGVVAEKIAVSRYDGTVKFLGKLHDGTLIETVLMPEKHRITICVSSQVGCAQACSFCYTGRMGLVRNLSAGEIVGQVMLANLWIRQHPRWCQDIGLPLNSQVSNLVFMGMGEPLDNVSEVLRAIDILTEPLGFAMAQRRISVSTAGHLEGLKALLSEKPNINIAFSLHASSDRERSQLMPINRKWPLGEVLHFIKEFYGNTTNKKRKVLIQYTLIHGVNDSMDHADALVELLKELPIKLNIIPLNEIDPSRFQSPAAETLEGFKNRIHQSGIRVMIRYSKGQDIAAACGQLVVGDA